VGCLDLMVWVNLQFLILLFNKDFSKLLKSDMPKLQLGRGALLMLTTCCMFAGLATLPFADHIAIYMIGPILTMILAIIFLKDLEVYFLFLVP